MIAFEDYNVIKGVLGSPWVGLEYFRRFFFIITGFYELSDEYIKAEYLWIIMGISGSDYSGITYESYSKNRDQEKSTASDLYAEFYICNSTLWYGSYAVITGRTFEQAAWD